MNDEHCESTQEKKEFFGREDKLKEIEQALECKKGAVVLHGLPGMGQTALARGICQTLQPWRCGLYFLSRDSGRDNCWATGALCQRLYPQRK